MRVCLISTENIIYQNMASAKPYHTNIIITSIFIIAHLMAPILSYIAELASAI